MRQQPLLDSRIYNPRLSCPPVKTKPSKRRSPSKKSISSAPSSPVQLALQEHMEKDIYRDLEMTYEQVQTERELDREYYITRIEGLQQALELQAEHTRDLREHIEIMSQRIDNLSRRLLDMSLRGVPLPQPPPPCVLFGQD